MRYRIVRALHRALESLNTGERNVGRMGQNWGRCYHPSKACIDSLNCPCNHRGAVTDVVCFIQYSITWCQCFEKMKPSGDSAHSDATVAVDIMVMSHLSISEAFLRRSLPWYLQYLILTCVDAVKTLYNDTRWNDIVVSRGFLTCELLFWGKTLPYLSRTDAHGCML